MKKLFENCRPRYCDCIDALNIRELPLHVQVRAVSVRLRRRIHVYARVWGSRWVLKTIQLKYIIGTPEYGVAEAKLLDLNYMLLIGQPTEEEVIERMAV